MIPWIQTRSGIKFDLAHPTVEMVTVQDIAFALARIHRFTGHSMEPYSVAQHSVWVAEHVSAEFKLEALMHDAAEAYIGDISAPVRHLLGRHLIELEVRIQKIIGKALGFDPLAGESEIRFWDLTALATERRDLMGPPPEPWHSSVESKTPVTGKISPWHPGAAEEVFMRSYRDLIKGCNDV